MRHAVYGFAWLVLVIVVPAYGDDCVPDNVTTSTQASQKERDCDRGERCQVHLVATPTSTNPEYFCSITPQEHKVTASRSKRGNTRFVWIIDQDPADNSFYRFQRKANRSAICLKSDDAFFAPGPEDVFARRFVWNLSASFFGSTSYWVYVERFDGDGNYKGLCELHDPIIANDS